MNRCRGQFNIGICGTWSVDGVAAGGGIQMNEEDDEGVQEERDAGEESFQG